MKNGISVDFEVGNSEKELYEVLESVEKFADYLELPKKKALYLRLITEELMGIKRALLDCGSCGLSVKSGGEYVEFSLSANSEIAPSAEAKLIEASASGKNSAYKGLTGIILKAFDEMRKGCAEVPNVPDTYPYEGFCGTAYIQGGLEWSLERYKKEAEREKKAEEYDALELSVVGKLAENIIVAVRPNYVSICVKYRI